MDEYIIAAGLTDEEQETFRTFCTGHGYAKPRYLFAEHHDECVGELVLAGEIIPGSTPAAGRAVLFAGMERDRIMQFFQDFRTLITPRPIFAAVTETSAEWNLGYLLEHLMEEHEQMRKNPPRPPQPAS